MDFDIPMKSIDKLITLLLRITQDPIVICHIK